MMNWDRYDPVGVLDDDHRNLAYQSATVGAVYATKLMEKGVGRSQAISEAMANEADGTLTAHGEMGERLISVARRMCEDILDGVLASASMPTVEEARAQLVAAMNAAIEHLVGEGYDPEDATAFVVGKFQEMNSPGGAHSRYLSRASSL